MQRTHRILALALVLGSASLVACGDDDNPAGGEGGELEVPTAYVFDSRFNAGESSVSYGGQVVRNLLLQDLKIFIDDLGKAGAQPATAADLLRFYEYDDAFDLQSLSDAGAKTVVENRYSAISTGKNLAGKISPAPVLSYGRSADELVREWFEAIAANAQDPDKLGTPAVYTTDEGVDLTQMINKVLIGAVVYHQSAGVYLDGLFERDNGAPSAEGGPYTAMEHGWDEAFGYFGAARDYGRYTDEQLAGGADDYTFDSNSDGMIDFRSEYNFGLSRNAGKRDRGGSGVDFTGEIFRAFRTGRALIADQGSVADISAQRQAAAEGMEKVIAATVVHYINDTLGDMAALGTDDENRVNLNKHWAEMKGFTVALQYSPFRLVSEDELRELHLLMGQAPAYDLPGSAAYGETAAGMARAKEILQQAYGFADANMAGW